MTLKKIKWTFPNDADPATRPDPDRILTLSGKVIKENPVRSVLRVVDPDNGIAYYIKHDKPQTIFKKIRSLFCSKSKLEFNASQFLRSQEIPVIRYEAYGEWRSESYLISKEINDHCAAGQFWFSLTEDPEDAEMRERFLAALTALLKKMNENKILHPDFHLGNLMCMPDAPENLLLPDPYGIRKVWFRDVTKYNSFVVTNLAAELTAGQGRAILCATGAKPEVWDILLEENKNMVETHWEKRKKQILSGDSKFCRTERIDGKEYKIRNSRWFTHVDFSPEQCRQIVLTPDQAMERWLESFRSELLYNTDDRPAALYITENEAVLFYNNI